MMFRSKIRFKVEIHSSSLAFDCIKRQFPFFSSSLAHGSVSSEMKIVLDMYSCGSQLFWKVDVLAMHSYVQHEARHDASFM